MPQSSVFNGADSECWQRRTVYFRRTVSRIVTAICCKVSCGKFQQYFILRFSKRYVGCEKSQCFPPFHPNMRTHFKPAEKVQYTFFTTCQPPGANKRLCQRWSSKNHQKNVLFEEFETLQIEHLKKTLPRLKKHPTERGYIYKNLLTAHSPHKWNFKKGHKPSSNKTKQRNEFCPS